MPYDSGSLEHTRVNVSSHVTSTNDSLAFLPSFQIIEEFSDRFFLLHLFLVILSPTRFSMVYEERTEWTRKQKRAFKNKPLKWLKPWPCTEKPFCNFVASCVSDFIMNAENQLAVILLQYQNIFLLCCEMKTTAYKKAKRNEKKVILINGHSLIQIHTLFSAW